MPLSQDQVFFAENLTIDNFIAEAALFTYEYLITFDQEVERIWRRKFSGASVIFLVNRYSNCLRIASYILANFGPQGRTHGERDFGNSFTPSCEIFHNLWSATAVINTFVVCAFLTLRMWAIWGRSWWALVAFLTLTIVSPAMELHTTISLAFAFTASLWRVSMEVSHSIGGFPIDRCISVPYSASTPSMRYCNMFGWYGVWSDLPLASITHILSPIQPGFKPFTDISAIFILNLRELELCTVASIKGTMSQIEFSSTIAGNIGAPLSFEIPQDVEESSPPKVRVTAQQAIEDPLTAGILYGEELADHAETDTSQEAGDLTTNIV
ncbi:hypothetical protein NLI96_g2956 [Meripilus lineatus]|uniref:DUF6533 domain-containing protein n=1 Tax=Meripilus lineatus TaxID=2056292 RepID=A0AAD5V7C8_9APHY|nr:hypothetical protein NLI96_g2956 [Physisporinus lineatus]